MTLPTPGPDRTALVTGASSGIGAEIARELARRGHGVTLVARSADKLDLLAADLVALGVRAETVVADLTDREERAHLPETLAQRGLTVDVLVNNAGRSTLGPVAHADPDDEMAMIELDVTAVVDLTVRFVHTMIGRGRGAVLNVASTAAYQPLPGQAGYGAAKAFVLSYTQSLATELRGTGVTATALCPGPVDTGFGAAAGISQADAEAALPSFMWVTPAEVARQAVDGLDRGRRVVIPGAANRIGSVLSALAPRALLLPVLARNHPGLKGD